MEFAAGKVLASEREAEQLQRIRVQLGGAADAYTKAGQYIQAKLTDDGKVGWFAVGFVFAALRWLLWQRATCRGTA